MLNYCRNLSISLPSFNFLSHQNSRNFQIMLVALIIFSILGTINSVGAATYGEIEERTSFVSPPRGVGEDLRSKAMHGSSVSRRGVPLLLKVAGAIAVAAIATIPGPDSNSHGLVALPKLGFPGAYAAEMPVAAATAATASYYAQYADNKVEMAVVPSGGATYHDERGIGRDEEHLQLASFALFQKMATNGHKMGLSALKTDASKGNYFAQGYLSIIYSDNSYISSDKYQAELYAGKSIEQLKEAAAKRSAHAQWLLGRMCAGGLGIAENDKEALRLIQDSAAQKYAPALLDLAFAKLGYYSVFKNLSNSEKDKEEGVSLCEHAAKLGYVPAQAALGQIYRNGDGVEKNDVKAIEWLTLAAEQDEINAQNDLSLMHEKSGNYAEAMKWYKRAAEQGDDSAKRKIGNMYRNGKGVSKDDKKALKWFIEVDTEKLDPGLFTDPIEDLALEGDLEALDWIKSKAERGDNKRQYILGLGNLKGKLLPKNKTEGFRWLRLAALNGHEYAAKLLGDLYLEEKLNNEAHRWYRLAADKFNNREAQYMLGYLYLEGIGVGSSEEASFYWFRRAASMHPYASEWGDKEAQYMVGLAYLEGRWVKQDLKEGAQWIQWSAKEGCVRAQALLGDLYAAGKGVLMDREKAEEWLKLAASKGNASARTRLEELQNKGTFVNTAMGIGSTLVVLISLWVKCLVM